ncbi:DMT family transporter [Flaviflexus equikiangi]|uniref:DMT family transporter n=1 Tax=Flaviflexus equikiangi TaxID=2758573 RepID=UPI0015F711BE|nr:multidrug efflux SMR transporter [Flaviflexus equikiangi]
MSWIVLLISGALEAVWAGALNASENFTRKRPTILFALAMVASMAGLAYATVELPIGTAYAVWVGVGASLTVAWSMVRGMEKASAARIILLLVLIGCVAGLKAVS